MPAMKTEASEPVLDRLVASLGDCLTPESARLVLALKADKKLQARVNALAERNRAGRITPDELDEYGKYVSYGTFVAILKSKARQRLSHLSGA